MKSIFLNPFERYSEKQLLGFGLPFTILGSGIAALFNARFDGMIDMHFIENVFWAAPFFDNLMNIGLLSLLLFFLGKYINKKTRLFDILAAVMVSRIPIYFLPIANANNYIFEQTKNLVESTIQVQTENLPIATMIVLFVFAMISLSIMIWIFILLWNGFKVATNAKGIKHIFLFILSLLICEAFTKILILYITW